MDSAAKTTNKLVHAKLQRFLPVPIQTRFRTFNQVTGIPGQLEQELRKLAKEGNELIKDLGVEPDFQIRIYQLSLQIE